MLLAVEQKGLDGIFVPGIDDDDVFATSVNRMTAHHARLISTTVALFGRSK